MTPLKTNTPDMDGRYCDWIKSKNMLHKVHLEKQKKENNGKY